MKPGIKIDKEKIAELCRRHHIQKLSLFGSAVRADFQPESDLDLLIEFSPDHTPGLAFFSLQDDFSKLFSRKVDLNTYQSLSPYFREQVLSEAEALYDTARS